MPLLLPGPVPDIDQHVAVSHPQNIVLPSLSTATQPNTCTELNISTKSRTSQSFIGATQLWNDTVLFDDTHPNLTDTLDLPTASIDADDTVYFETEGDATVLY
jgi:hypothetical protein